MVFLFVLFNNLLIFYFIFSVFGIVGVFFVCVVVIVKYVKGFRVVSEKFIE